MKCRFCPTGPATDGPHARWPYRPCGPRSRRSRAPPASWGAQAGSARSSSRRRSLTLVAVPARLGQEVLQPLHARQTRAGHRFDPGQAGQRLVPVARRQQPGQLLAKPAPLGEVEEQVIKTRRARLQRPRRTYLPLSHHAPTRRGIPSLRSTTGLLKRQPATARFNELPVAICRCARAARSVGSSPGAVRRDPDPRLRSDPPVTSTPWCAGIPPAPRSRGASNNVGSPGDGRATVPLALTIGTPQLAPDSWTPPGGCDVMPRTEIPTMEWGAALP